jgi:hypothetical protein
MRLDPAVQADADLAAVPAAHEPSVFGDIPRFGWIAYLSAWAFLFGLFVLFFAADGPAALAVLTSCFFACMLLGLPAALGTQAERAPRPSAGAIVTGSGTLPVSSAAIQILSVPVGACIGLAALILFAL